MLTEQKFSGIVNIGSGNAITILEFAKQLLPESMIVEYDKKQEGNSLVANIDKLIKFENKHEK